MSKSYENAIKGLLRPSEVIKIALEARAADVPVDSDQTRSSVHRDDAEDVAQRPKILAVVGHTDSGGGLEQGCVFIFKSRVQRSPADPREFTIERIYPILGDFSISMAQPPRQGAVSISPSTPSTLDQPRTELTLTIKAGHDLTAKPISLFTYDTQSLRSVLAECRRLKELSAHQGYTSPTTYAWTAPYVLTRRRPHLMSSLPPDLREINKPLHTRLSVASAGFPGEEAEDIATIRDAWIRATAQREATLTEKASTLRIRIGTFNVNGKMPSQDLSAWVRGHPDLSKTIPPLEEISPLSLGEVVRDPLENQARMMQRNTADETTSSRSEPHLKTPVDSASTSATTLADPALSAAAAVIEDPADPDLLVLAFQELDLSAEALIYSTKTLREDAWSTAAFAGLGEKAVLYEKLASKQLVGMLLVIIVKRSLGACFHDVKSASIGAGIMGVMGNKGATALRLAYTPSTATHGTRPRPAIFTFVNAHLAAFDEMYEKRNADFQDLSKRLIFDSGIPTPASLPASGSVPATIPLSIYETDVLFWMVYLNYRVDLPDADVRTLLASELWEEDVPVLLKYDQLGLAIRTKKAFEGFIEHPITHAPSYRFGAGGPCDGRGYDLKRRPAWTDRILRMSSQAVAIDQLTYSSHAEISMSDHRPVSADFEVHVPLVETAAYESSIRKLWRSVAHFEDSEEPPKVQISPTNIDFGKISYRRCISKDLAIRNLGKVPCVYRFVAARPGVAIHARWVRLEPMTGLLLPGDSATIILTAYVDVSAATRMNLEAARLEDTLILHTALGKDHFVSITGEYERTCYAAALPWLARLPGPIRALTSLDELLPEDRAMTAPREVMRLVNWLMGNAENSDGLFVTAGEDALMENIRECLDTGAEFTFDRAHDDPRVAWAFAESLLQLLASLPEPVVPVPFHARCAQATNRDEAFEILDAFPSVSLNVWISITAFLHFIGQQSPPRRAEQLVAKFASVLLRDDLGTATPVSPIGKRNFVRHFVG